VPGPCTWLHQVHGTDVVVVAAPGEHAGFDADAAVTATAGCALAVRTADCVPVALLADGAAGIAHAGWRGLLGGVVEATVAALVTLGVETTAVRAEIGPCIRAGCYEFDGPQRAEVARRYGDAVLATTVWGAPALDLVGGARAALGAAGVGRVDVVGGCTACDTTWYSHRARGDAARQASFVWLEP
jgi:YfiH family protein